MDPLRRSQWSAFFSLFTSGGTLICCALPALLVALGAGATLASLVNTLPQLIWVSEHKTGVFGLATCMLFLAGVWQWRARHAPCPVDPQQAEACRKARQISFVTYLLSLIFYGIGGLFAFVLPWFQNRMV